MNWLRLGIPILLGLAAGTLNYLAMNTGQTAEKFLRLRDDLKAGEPFESDNLEEIEMRGDISSLKETAIPYRNRKVLLNRPALRDMRKGDLLLWRDVTPPRAEMNLLEGEAALPIPLEGLAVPQQLIQVGDQVEFIIAQPVPPPPPPSGTGNPPIPPTTLPTTTPRPKFVTVGPFRVVSVGDVVIRPGRDDKEGRPAEQRVISVAFKRKDGKIDDPNVQELLHARWDDRGGTRRLVEIVLSPRRQPGRDTK